jgi:hypothetical protein
VRICHQLPRKSKFCAASGDFQNFARPINWIYKHFICMAYPFQCPVQTYRQITWNLKFKGSSKNKNFLWPLVSFFWMLRAELEHANIHHTAQWKKNRF